MRITTAPNAALVVITLNNKAAGNLVFQGTVHGHFEAYTADTGRKLWSFQTHRGIVAGPVSYRAGGEQYVAVMAGYGGSMGMASATPFEKRRMPMGMILAFKLGGRGTMPPYTPEPLPPANPSSESFTSEQVARGEKQYSAFCSICHTDPGFSGARPANDVECAKAAVEEVGARHTFR